MSNTLVAFLAVALALLLAAAVLWRARRGRDTRGAAARQLRDLLSEYLRLLNAPAVQPAQAEAMWALLQQVRALQRAHFPALYGEMLTLSRLHAELADAWLKTHMERHGAPTGWDALEASGQVSALQRQAREAVQQLDARCAQLGGLR